MKRLVGLILLVFILSSHDLFIKMDSYFLQPNTDSKLSLFNGTFENSENIITRDRMLDVSIVSNGKRMRVDSSQWSDVDSTQTVLDFTTGSSGTYLAGVSTRARNIALSASDFNDYLEHDGVLDMLEKRKTTGTLYEDAVEKYSKHVKAVFQVGDSLSNDWKAVLGYPIEFIPQQNPYSLTLGNTIQVLLLRDGNPLSDQLVYAGFADSDHTHTGEHTHEAHHHDEQQRRTDKNGMCDFKIDHSGLWYVRTIHLVESDIDSLTHESNWASLSFEVRSSASKLNLPMLLIFSFVLLIVAFVFYIKSK